MKERNLAFDLVKLFAIVLVLWGHCIQHMKSSNIDEPVFLFIYSFHMPLFMMISGYFSLSSYSMRLYPFLGKKFLQLILPCITWFFITYLLPKLLLYPVYGNRLNYSMSSFLYVLLHNFWFLKSVFVCYVLAYCGFKLKWIGIIATLLISQIIPLYSVGFLYPVFLVGVCLAKCNILLDCKMRRFMMALSFGLWVLLLFKMSWIEYNYTIQDIVSNPEILAKRTYRVFVGIFGSVFWIALFLELFEKRKNGRGIITSLAKYGKYTLAIYILQTFILEKGLSSIIRLDSFGLLLSDFVLTPLIAFVVAIICILIIIPTEKSRLLRLFLWGYR